MCPACRKAFTVPAPARPRRRCPRCSAIVASDAALCLRCGLSLSDAGAGPRPPGPPVEEAEEPGPVLRFLEWLAALVPGLFRPWILLAVVVLILLASGVMFFALFIIGLGALIEGFLIAGFGLMIYGEAMAVLVYGEMGFLHDILADIDARRLWLWFALVLAPVAAYFLFLRLHAPDGG